LEGVASPRRRHRSTVVRRGGRVPRPSESPLDKTRALRVLEHGGGSYGGLNSYRPQERLERPLAMVGLATASATSKRFGAAGWVLTVGATRSTASSASAPPSALVSSAPASSGARFGFDGVGFPLRSGVLCSGVRYSSSPPPLFSYFPSFFSVAGLVGRQSHQVRRLGRKGSRVLAGIYRRPHLHGGGWTARSIG
jgi:hypothetical protein